MTVDTQLLQRAFPQGFLPMVGASTTLHFTCTHAVEDHIVWFHTTTGDTFKYWQGQWYGTPPYEGLLPNLDPEGDPATWACAKRHLFDLLWPGEGDGVLYEITWTRIEFVNHIAWVLDADAPVTGLSVSMNFRVGDTIDPAEALCHALASLRAQEDSDAS